LPDARSPADLVLRHARVITCAGQAPRRGSDQARLETFPGGVVASNDGVIVFAGKATGFEDVIAPAPRATVIDLAGRTVLPGFVDPHTHAVFAGDRRDELRRRLGGESYTSIAAQGGGILSTVGATRAASESDLVRQSRGRLDAMLACGTTTAEVKSGYGLDTPTELKILHAIRQLTLDQPIDLVPTFLGAHEVPVEYRTRRSAFVSLVVEEMIPEVARLGLAESCDVFCEKDVFDPAESLAILEAGARAGLEARVHADEFGRSGGSLVAAAVRARSADHLIFAEDAEIASLAGAGVVATLTPIAAFYLKLGRYAPARALIDAGVPVALATDLNPGGGQSPSMPFAMTLACFAMGLTLEESITAATINAAYAINRHRVAGSLEIGKQMDAVVVRRDPVDLLRVGEEAIEMVVKRGRIVVDRRGSRAS
jgi:imidazolonepropionase